MFGWKRCSGSVTILAFAAAQLLMGCGKSEAPVLSVAPQAERPETGAASAPAESKPAAAAAAPAAEEPKGDFLHQPFEAAIRPELPVNGLPPLMTATGKSVGKLYADVVKQWPSIRFVDEAGRKLRYTAHMETDQGTIEIELWPDVAPNHVRSFVALARAGYYDGLFFETRLGNPRDINSPRGVAGGSPEADGNDLGSVGYWLLPEILLPEVAARRGIRHRPGVLGAVHAFAQADTAGCRFYFCLSDAPMWDGEYTIFGRIIRGLEVAESIFQQPVADGEAGQSPFQKLPAIRSVTISVQPLEKGASTSDNSQKE